MEEVKKIFEKLGIPCGPEKIEKLSDYMEEILELNKHINLTAITDRRDFIRKHYVDSLLCAGLEEFKDSCLIIDVGTGGGFPGVPLAIAFPDKQFTLIDSLNKRIKIINELCGKLSIENVTAIHGRAEELARRKDMRESFDLCVSRAVANMSTLSEYCLPFVKVGGAFIAYKGPGYEQELETAANAIKLLGGEVSGEKSPEVSDILGSSDIPFDHKLIVINKIENTVSKFPRKAGTPSKEPIK